MADSKRICLIQGCENPHSTRGFCKRHYDRARRGAAVKKSLTCFDFIRNLDPNEKIRCIEWPFAKNHRGYGWVRFKGRPHLAHRVSLIYWVGDPPSPQHEAAHAPVICHNPACVNPRHLSWKTPAENAADRVLDGTMEMCRGENNVNHRLKTEEVAEIKMMREVPSKVLAEKFNVKPGTILKIWSGCRRAHG